MASILGAAMLGYVGFEARVVFKSMKVAGRPSLRDLIAAQSKVLHIQSHGKVNRSEVENKSYDELGVYLHEKFKPNKPFDDWSIDWCFPHIDYNGKKQPGYWADNSHRPHEATVFFYEDRTPKPPPPPPPPEPKPEPETGWTAADEKARIESYQFNPLAFWLAPDWEGSKKTGLPIWMLPPADVFEEPEDELVQQLAAALRRKESIPYLEHQTIGQATKRIVYFEDRVVTAAQYQSALRAARLLR